MTAPHWTKPGIEPDLCELLADPIVVSLMRADRVTRSDVLAAGARVSASLADQAMEFDLPA